jgi:hypothetical protein
MLTSGFKDWANSCQTVNKSVTCNMWMRIHSTLTNSRLLSISEFWCFASLNMLTIFTITNAKENKLLHTRSCKDDYFFTDYTFNNEKGKKIACRMKSSYNWLKLQRRLEKSTFTNICGTPWDLKNQMFYVPGRWFFTKPDDKHNLFFYQFFIDFIGCKLGLHDALRSESVVSSR